MIAATSRMRFRPVVKAPRVIVPTTWLENSVPSRALPADADAAHDHAGDEMGPRRARVEAAHQQQPDPDDDQAGADEQPDRHP